LTTYIEPFLGGGAVALSLLPLSPKPFLRWPGGKRKLTTDVVAMLGIVDNPDRLILADVNAPLIALWQAVRNNPDQLIAELRGLPRSPEGYLKARSDSNAKTTPATTFYLNLFAFNGLQRVNSKGHNNVPCDAVRLAKLDLDAVARNVLEVSRALRQHHTVAVDTLVSAVDIIAADFETTITLASRGDFVYCDPPYIGTFTGYSRKRFGVDEHVKLWQAAVAATLRGARVVISNGAAALPMYVGLAEASDVTLSYKHVTARRSIAAKSSSRGDVGEVMVSPRLP
jgi:DNA adenine methylase Dam